MSEKCLMGNHFVSECDCEDCNNQDCPKKNHDELQEIWEKLIELEKELEGDNITKFKKQIHFDDFEG